MTEKTENGLRSFSIAGLLATIGIVFSSIGTAPLYTLKAVTGEAAGTLNEVFIYGTISLIFWTITIQTTFKYIFLTLRADNRGEGGIFALFTLLQNKTKPVAVFTMIGVSALLAVCVLTPVITVTSSVESWAPGNQGFPVIPIVVVILIILFFIQQFGTKFISSSFMPVMVAWFLIMAVFGILSLAKHPGILAAVNPVYAFRFLTGFPEGFLFLGLIFLSTTGAEILFSSIGLFGRHNIQVIWIFVKPALLLNYFGQGAWLLENISTAAGSNPFFSMLPSWFLLPAIIFSIAAAFIASQSLLSSSFTLISEAVSLNFWPGTRIINPTGIRGQVYPPLINGILFILCCIAVIALKDTAGMATAYSLAGTIVMAVTTLLMALWLLQGKRSFNTGTISAMIAFLVLAEGSFLISNFFAFNKGVLFTMILMLLFFMVMVAWYFGRKLKNRYISFSCISDYKSLLIDLHNDTSVPRYATNLVYIIKADHMDQVESKVFYSILQKQPKRAETYWFLHVSRVDEPDRFEYQFNTLIPGVLNRIDFYLGFKVEPRINLYFREVLEDLVKSGEITLRSCYDSLKRNNFEGDFRFILIDRVMLRDNKLTALENFILTIHGLVRTIGIDDDKILHLDPTSTIVEQVPITIKHPSEIRIHRCSE